MMMNKRVVLNRYLIWYIALFIAVAAIFLIIIYRNVPHLPAQFCIGRKATLAEIRKLDIDVSPDGKGLPAGSGNIQSGKLVYQAKCIACHGNGQPTENPLLGEALFVNHLTEKTKTIGTYWPYATTIFDYVRRAMPYNAPGSLSNQEVYDLTAYLLYANKIIPANAVINQQTLQKVVMPAKEKYVEDDRRGGKEIR